MEEDFNHQLAIRLSRALNTLNPNDLLAQRVTYIAKTKSVEDFIKGTCNFYHLSSVLSISAAGTFGKFQDSFLAELHADILLHAKQEETGVVPQPVQGITVHDSDVLEPPPARPGGLMRPDTVRKYPALSPTR